MKSPHSGTWRLLEARIYSAEIVFTRSPPPLGRLARDLSIVPEGVHEIEEDSWGIRGSLEIWFGEIDGPKLTVHIQRAHFKHKETYLEDLRSFFTEVEALPYVERVQLRDGI